MPTPSAVALIAAAYLWGSLSPAFSAARALKGIDLRQYGSGNVGGSNVGVQLGRAWTFAIGFLDLLKGFVPTLLAQVLGFDMGTVVLVSLATVIGHNWSAYLAFAGGRGIGATIGVLFALDLRLATMLTTIVAVGWVTRQGATTAIIGVCLLAPVAWLVGDAPEIVVAAALLTLINAIKRLEANRLPLPRHPHEKRVVLWRRLWMDRDVPPDQPWQERGRIDQQ